MTDHTLDGTLNYKNKTLTLHSGEKSVPFKNPKAITEITVNEGNAGYKISVNGKEITYQSLSTSGAQLGLTPPVKIVDAKLAINLTFSVLGSFDAHGKPIQEEAEYISKIAEYIQKKVAGPHAQKERDDEHPDGGGSRGGDNFDFKKSPFKEGQTRLHVSEGNTGLSLWVRGEGIPKRIQLNAEQTPQKGLFTYQSDPAFKKVEVVEHGDGNTIYAQAVHPIKFVSWFDRHFMSDDGSVGKVNAPTIAAAVRKAVGIANLDKTVTEPEALAMAKLQEKLFEFVMKFPKDKPLDPKAQEKLIKANERSIIQLANDVISASIPPVNTTASVIQVTDTDSPLIPLPPLNTPASAIPKGKPQGIK